LSLSVLIDHFHRSSFSVVSACCLYCVFKPRLHDTTGCQTGLTAGLTTVLNEQLFVQPVVKPGCTTGLTTGLTTGCIVYPNIYPVVSIMLRWHVRGWLL